MKRLMGLGSLAAAVVASGCSSVGDEYVYNDIKTTRPADQHMVTSLQDEQEFNGIIRQKTVFPYHFLADSPALTELGKHNLDILAHHYKDNVLPYAGGTKVLQEVKVYFDYDKSFIRPDAHSSLDGGVDALNQNPDADIIITGRADQRGSEEYNDKLGARRAEEVRQYLISKGASPDRVKIVSRGKLDAAAPTSDEPAMQLDRNAVFQVAEIQDFPVTLNVKRGDASEELYDARKKSVNKYLAEQGLDTSRVELVDGFPGGSGMPSKQAVIFLIQSYTNKTAPQGTEQVSASIGTGNVR